MYIKLIVYFILLSKERVNILPEFSFLNYVQEMFSNPVLFVTVLLTLGVIFVNGWTDAPNAIATCVATRSIAPKAAVLMSAVFNFFGVFVMTMINSSVAMTITKMVNFSAGVSNSAEANEMTIVALCAALVAIIVWAVAAWWFGIPTSESHALIAGLTGSALAISGGQGVNMAEWQKVLIGLVLSTILGFAMGFITTKITEFICRNMDRRKTVGFFKGAQIAGGAAMSFMHGAQDGQKFIGVLLLSQFLVNGVDVNKVTPQAPWELMIVCSIVMALGTSLGGYKIIKAVGMDMVKLQTYQGFSADMAGAGCLLISSVFGIPVSTTHTKTVAIMGVGATKRLSAINMAVVKDMVLTWILTFPGCGLIGYIMSKLFLAIF